MYKTLEVNLMSICNLNDKYRGTVGNEREILWNKERRIVKMRKLSWKRVSI